MSPHGWLGWKKGIVPGLWEQMDLLSYLAVGSAQLHGGLRDREVYRHVCSVRSRHAPPEEVEDREARKNGVIRADNKKHRLCADHCGIYVLKRRAVLRSDRVAYSVNVC